MPATSPKTDTTPKIAIAIDSTIDLEGIPPWYDADRVFIAPERKTTLTIAVHGHPALVCDVTRFDIHRDAWVALIQILEEINAEEVEA